METAKHEYKCSGCGETIHQGESVTTIFFPQICGENITYTYHPRCYAKVMRQVHEVNEFYKWKRKNQRKLDIKYKVKQILRRLR